MSFPTTTLSPFLQSLPYPFLDFKEKEVGKLVDLMSLWRIFFIFSRSLTIALEGLQKTYLYYSAHIE